MNVKFQQTAQRIDPIKKSAYNPYEIVNDELVQYTLKILATELLNQSDKLEQIDFAFTLTIRAFNTNTLTACSMMFNSTFNASGADVLGLLKFQDSKTVDELARLYSLMLNGSIQIFDTSLIRVDGFKKLVVNRTYTPKELHHRIGMALYQRGQ